MKKKEKPSGSAFPLAVFMFAMGVIIIAHPIVAISVGSVPFWSILGIGMILGSGIVCFGAAAVFYWEYTRDKKYDVLIEQENRERERQLQEQTSSQR